MKVETARSGMQMAVQLEGLEEVGDKVQHHSEESPLARVPFGVYRVSCLPVPDLLFELLGV